MASEKTREIRTLLLVFAGGIAAALLFALGMLYHYNPSGTYIAKNVLLDPAHVTSLRFSDTNVKSSEATRYIFDKIQFSYFDSAQKEWKVKPLTLQQYGIFYALVGNEKSISDVSDEVVAHFSQGHPAILALKIRRENNNLSSATDLFRVDFVDNGDYYRVQLRNSGTKEGWVYYYHPDIYKRIIEIFH